MYQEKKKSFSNGNFLFDQTRNPTLQVFYHTRVSKARGIQTPNRTVPNLRTRCGAIAWTLKEELGKDLIEASIEGDSVKVETLLSSQGVESFINYQNKHGVTPLQYVTVNDQENVTKLVIEARCNINLVNLR